MLFSDFRFILQFAKGKLLAFKVDIRGLKIAETLEQEFINWEELPVKLTEIKKVFEDQEFFLLIPEKEAKLYLFKLPQETQNVVSAIEEQLGLQAEDSLSSLTYDLKRMGVDDEEGIAYFQAIVARREYLLGLQTALGKSKIKVATIENPSFSLARLTAKVKVPHLIYHRDAFERVLCACFEGEVFAAQVLDVRKRLENATDEMVHEVRGRYGFEIKSLLLSPQQAEEAEDIKGLRVKEESLLHPALGLALKQDIKGADLDVLSLRFPKVETRPKGVLSTQRRKLAALSILLLVVLASVFWLAKDLSGSQGLKKYLWFSLPAPSPTSTPTPLPTVVPSPTYTPTPTPTPLRKADLKVQILNGSGVTGAARRAREFLVGDGWSVISIGNASRYGYASTQIQIKKSKEDFVKLLKEKLAEKYQMAEAVGELPEEESVDAIVVIGKS